MKNAVKNIFLFALIIISIKIYGQKPKRIELLHADVLKGGGKLGRDVKRLIGDVRFKHEGAIMYCDSAHFNSETNAVDAYGNVHINQDSLDLYGDYINYDGNTKIAKVRDNVRLIHGDSKLYTNFLDYDRNTNIGTYFNHGKIIDKNNDLQSNKGFYYSKTKDYYAIDTVILLNPKYTIYTDTLRYNTGSDISYFYGPTEIISDSNYIYCENGWYDTHKDISQFNKNAFLRRGDKTLSGDSLFYNRKNGFGEAFKNIILNDTTQKVILEGNYGIFYEIKENALITDSTLLIQVSDKDSLFLHADTLKLLTFFDTIPVFDTILLSKTDTVLLNNDSLKINKKDSLIANNNDSLVRKYPNKRKEKDIYADIFIKDTIIIDSLGNKVKIIEKQHIKKRKEIYAYNKVRIYKNDFQGKCDSLVYYTNDSLLRFFTEPVLWSKENQISGINIDLYMKNNEPDHMLISKKAMIVSQEDSASFDQISGKKIYAYFRNNEIYKVNVFGNAESVYFPREEAKQDSSLVNTTQKQEKGDFVGVNIAKGSNMTIFIENKKPIKIVLHKKPDGSFNPVDYLPKEKLILKNFSWQLEKRPNNKYDIFIWK